MSGCVDDVNAMLGQRGVHPLPEAGGCRRSNGDAALLLLLHPVHGGRAIVNLADFVINACVKKDALGGGGLSGVNVGANADVAIAVDGSLTSHGLPVSTRRLKRDGESLEPEMREGLVGLCHTMNLITTLHCSATALGGFKELAGEPEVHGLLTPLFRGLTQPTHGKG